HGNLAPIDIDAGMPFGGRLPEPATDLLEDRAARGITAAGLVQPRQGGAGQQGEPARRCLGRRIEGAGAATRGPARRLRVHRRPPSPTPESWASSASTSPPVGRAKCTPLSAVPVIPRRNA